MLPTDFDPNEPRYEDVELGAAGGESDANGDLPSVYSNADLPGYRRVCRTFPHSYGFVLSGPHAQDVSEVVAWLAAEGGEEGVDFMRLPDEAGALVEIRFKDFQRFQTFMSVCGPKSRAEEAPAPARTKRTAKTSAPATGTPQEASAAPKRAKKKRGKKRAAKASP